MPFLLPDGTLPGAQSKTVLVACECSGRVRDAFSALGFDAVSCDLKPDEQGSDRHHQIDVTALLRVQRFDLVVAHPPCTYLCNSGVRWLSEDCKKTTVEERWEGLREGAQFFIDMLTADSLHVAVENPVMHCHARELIAQQIPSFNRPDQIVQPHWFGERAFKATGLYLRGLPKLQRTHNLAIPKNGTQEHKEWSFIHLASNTSARTALRSRTFQAVADAMAMQWGCHILKSSK